MKKLIPWVLIFLLIIGVFGMIARYYFKKEPEKLNELRLYGNVDMREVSLAFKANERLEQLLVEEGDKVEKKQLLACLETVHLELAVKAAEARVKAQQEIVGKLVSGSREEEIKKAYAKVDAAAKRVKNAEVTYRRLKALAAEKLTSRQKADDAQARMQVERAELKVQEESLNLVIAGPRKEDIDSAKAQLEIFEVELDIARQNLADTCLYAPSDGIIRNRILEKGDMASPQRPVFTMALLNPVWIRAYVSETDLGKIFPGMKALVMTDSYPDKTYDGWLGYISPTAEFTPKSVQTPEIRTQLVYQIRVMVRNSQNELRLGMPATIIIPFDQSKLKNRNSAVPPFQRKNE